MFFPLQTDLVRRIIRNEYSKDEVRVGIDGYSNKHLKKYQKGFVSHTINLLCYQKSTLTQMISCSWVFERNIFIRF